MSSLPSHHARRLAQFQATLQPDQVALISHFADVEYFTGFSTLLPTEHEAFLLVSPTRSHLLHAAFSPYQLPKSLETLLQTTASSSLTTVKKTLSSWDEVTTVLIDESDLRVKEAQALPTQLQSKSLDKQEIWKLRTVKDESERELLTRAGEIAAAAFLEVVGEQGEHLSAGITESRLSQLLERSMIEKGASGPAFPTIVAFGAAGALPHHQPDDQPLKPETPVLIDMGATFRGYRSDMTRSFWFGSRPTPDYHAVTTVVRQAYEAAVTAIAQPNLVAAELDTAARQIITAAGYGDYFIHTTGHGVGLEIHEPPSLNSENTTPLQPDIAITVEPGIYLENKFGVRYENTLLLTTQQPICLTSTIPS